MTTFAESVQAGRKLAVIEFVTTTTMTLARWESLEWNEWHTQPELAHLALQPLGGLLKFPGSEMEETCFRFQQRQDGMLLGVEMEVKANNSWTGTAKDVNDAAREAITTLLEMAYLRGKQS